jgi:hypothetical protein
VELFGGEENNTKRIQNKACKKIIEEEGNIETRSERGNASTRLTTPADQIARWIG